MTKKEMAKKMIAKLDKGGLSKGINSFVGKHPKFSSNKILAGIDRWSFRNSPQMQKWIKEAKL